MAKDISGIIKELNEIVERAWVHTIGGLPDVIPPKEQTRGLFVLANQLQTIQKSYNRIKKVQKGSK